MKVGLPTVISTPRYLPHNISGMLLLAATEWDVNHEARQCSVWTEFLRGCYTRGPATNIYQCTFRCVSLLHLKLQDQGPMP